MNFDTSAEIEVAIANYFDPRRNIIVPNIWWGWGLNHECDLVVLTKTGFAYEVEIKCSRQDLRADRKKNHGHRSQRLRKLYFAVPEKLESYALELIPEHAGLLMVGQGLNRLYGLVCKIREASINPGARRLTIEEQLRLAVLGNMRIWPLKRSVLDLYEKNQEIQNSNWRLEYLG